MSNIDFTHKTIENQTAGISVSKTTFQSVFDAIRKIVDKSYRGSTEKLDADLVGGQGPIEFGSNSNGSYIKFGDGTLICTATFVWTTAITITWGSWYISTLPNTWYMPCEFYTLYGISVFADDNAGNGASAFTTYSNNSYVSFFLARGDTLASTPLNVRAIAIGRWKA